MYSFCAMYSFKISFCNVPEIFFQSAPCFSATARYIAQITEAGELIVIEVVTSASGILSNSVSMSASELIATPHFPTSPSDKGWSESYPINVGKSKATEGPVCPWEGKYRNLRLVSSAAPKPANWRMVHRRPRYMVE